VLVVDDHAIFAQAVQSLLSREPDLRPVWIANTVGEARTLLSRHRPTVVVLDLVLGDGSGLDLADQAREQSPDTRVLMLTGITSTEPVVAALRRGVCGWLPKTVDSDRLVRVIRGVAHGEAWLAPELLGTVLPQLVGQPGAVPPDPLAGLTAREREVLQCLVDGLTRTEIASRLYLSANTVRTHTQNVLVKLGVHATLEAVALALRHGMVQRPAQGPPPVRVPPPSEVPPQRPQPIRPATRPPPPGGLTQIA
jgi:DNA-binding NarL/FixJ family response regulator